MSESRKIDENGKHNLRFKEEKDIGDCVCYLKKMAELVNVWSEGDVVRQQFIGVEELVE